MVHMSLENASIHQPEAYNLYTTSPQHVKELIHQFFRSMDVNSDGGVSWFEIHNFFNKGSSNSNSNSLIHPPFPPQLQYQLFLDLDLDRNGSLSFSEFITFFHCLFLRAKCNQCQRDLIGDDYVTCVDCFDYATRQSGCVTFDLCSSCCNSVYGFAHFHHRNRFKKYMEVVFGEMFMAAGMVSGVATGANFMTGMTFVAPSGGPTPTGMNYMATCGGGPTGGNYIAASGGSTGSNTNSEIEARRETSRRRLATLQAAANLVTIGSACNIM